MSIVQEFADGSLRISRGATAGSPNAYVGSTPDVLLAGRGDAVIVGDDSPRSRDRRHAAAYAADARYLRAAQIRARLAQPMPWDPGRSARFSSFPHVRAAADLFENEVCVRRVLRHELDQMRFDEELAELEDLQERRARVADRRRAAMDDPLLASSPMYRRYLDRQRAAATPARDSSRNVRALAPTTKVRRSFAAGVRSVRADGQVRLVGHAAIYDSLSEDLGGWREKLSPGCFDDCLRGQISPVFALWQHDPNFVIASTSDQSLKLSTDRRGLVCDISPMDTQMVRDMVVKPIQDGKVTSMSFAFDVADAEWTYENGMDIRVVKRVGRLYDVSPVCSPAYMGTDISARGALLPWQRAHIGA